jgi:hypothetical protein
MQVDIVRIIEKPPVKSPLNKNAPDGFQISKFVCYNSSIDTSGRLKNDYKPEYYRDNRCLPEVSSGEDWYK